MATAALLRSQIQAQIPAALVLTPRPARDCLSTGIPEIDQLTQGGIPRGAMTEIAGEPSSGRTTVFLSLLAQATQRGEYCALIDAHDSFNPHSAAACGAVLARLLWIRCGGNVEHALNAADRMVHAGGFGMVAFDLADADLFAVRRISLASWYRLRHAVGNTPAALVVLSRHFNARSCSHLQLEMRRTGAVWSGHLLRSLAFEAETRKHQMSKRAGFEAQRFAPLG